jgi:hypothetical protein
MQIVIGVEAVCRARNAEAVHSGALEALARIEPLRGKTPELLYLPSAWRADLPREAHASLWLIHSSAQSILELLDADKSPDWDRLGAASVFAEGGVEQLQANLASSGE